MRQVPVILCLLVAACGGGETTESSVAPPLGTIADTTTTLDTTTGTSSPITTTTEAPAPVSGIVATVTGLLGWWDGDGWVSAGSAAPPLQRDSEYQLVYLNDPITTQDAGIITTDDFEICSTPNSGLQFPQQENWLAPSPIAISADWDLRPHRIELLGTSNKTYENETKKLLPKEAKTGGLELVQVIRTDLEGDGITEVIVTAQSISDTNLIQNKPGEFSIVYLRKVIDNEVQTAVLHSFVTEDFGEGNFGYMAPAYVSAIADLNGDGKMEIALDSFYYEGRSTIVYEYVNDDLEPTVVMSAGCGA